MLTDASFSSTGWQGSPPPPLARNEIVHRWFSGEIQKDIASFLPLPYRYVEHV
jgi:hypothetical protein